jgi:hypothetical protein
MAAAENRKLGMTLRRSPSFFRRFLKKAPRRLEMVMSRPEMQQRLRLAKWLALSWLLASFAVSVVLLLFLYLGHDWARLPSTRGSEASHGRGVDGRRP